MPANRNCLFLVDDSPLSPNATGGASAVYYSRLDLLAHSNVGVDLVVLTYEDQAYKFDHFREEQQDIWQQVEGWCTSWRVVKVPSYLRRSNPLKNLLLSVVNPKHMFENFAPQTLDKFRELTAELQTDIIWAEHLTPTAFAHAASVDVPIVFSHHDWKWRIKQHRVGNSGESLRSKLRFWQTRRYEEQLVREVAACVSGSLTEVDEIKALGANQVAYLPTTYAAVLPPHDSAHDERPRIVHLGGMATTANRLGLDRFLDVVWPTICESVEIPPEFWVIGSMEGASEQLKRKLNSAGAILTGYIDDLSTVLRPYDIHIIPWEYNTGTRTRIPLILNHAQVLVTTQAAAACIPELTNQLDSILVQTLPEMAAQILALLPNAARRIEIGKAGRETFLHNFTRETLQPRFDAFLRQLG